VIRLRDVIVCAFANSRRSIPAQDRGQPEIAAFAAHISINNRWSGDSSPFRGRRDGYGEQIRPTSLTNAMAVFSVIYERFSAQRTEICDE
jgi:hypothetical protein